MDGHNWLGHRSYSSEAQKQGTQPPTWTTADIPACLGAYGPRSAYRAGTEELATPLSA